MYEFNVRLRVRYAETDQMGYCYYGNYAQYFEVARVETLRSLGVSYKEIEDNGILLPVSDYQIKYILPAFYDEELNIKCVIKEISEFKIKFEYPLFNELLKPPLFKIQKSGFIFFSLSSFFMYNNDKSVMKLPNKPSGQPTFISISEKLITLFISLEMESL